MWKFSAGNHDEDDDNNDDKDEDDGDDIIMSLEAWHELTAITHLHIHDSSACLVSHCHHPPHNSGDSHEENECKLI